MSFPKKVGNQSPDAGTANADSPMGEAEQHPVVYYRSQGKAASVGSQYPVPSTMTTQPSREDQEDQMFDEALAPYRGLGLSLEGIRELAAALGDSLVEALLSENEPTSVALVLLPCDPPGRDTTGFIRQIAERFSRAVICLYPASVTFPGMQEALHLSLPDVIGKLHFLPIPSPSLVAALDAAKLGDIRPGHALEVFVPDAIKAQVGSEKDGGGLPVDPTTIMLSDEGIPVDDPQRVRNVLAQPTDAPAKQVLDPHVFSDPQGMQRVRRALGDQQLAEVGMLAAPQNSSPRGGALGRGGNQSSSWSSGRLALRNPKDHVPVDDNEHGQIQLDTEYGIKLPQPEEYEELFGRKS